MLVDPEAVLWNYREESRSFGEERRCTSGSSGPSEGRREATGTGAGASAYGEAISLAAALHLNLGEEIVTMRSGRLRIPAEGNTRPSKTQRRAQRKSKCPANCSINRSAQRLQSSGPDQLVAPITPFQLYFKKSRVANKSDFLKDPAAAFFLNPDIDEWGLPTHWFRKYWLQGS
ncbi:hypothetical protein NDU88_003890 [Pleurodeles waltl]|uniref:Uncharacterized protein n=1 Tax=Pleurodeles waltl TaxID=8319 RepID=A0AAV7SH80_PLEWA|nr:hypothetical protein NDU88_003890 [Pleurodeles waltl]